MVVRRFNLLIPCGRSSFERNDEITRVRSVILIVRSNSARYPLSTHAMTALNNGSRKLVFKQIQTL